jgi:phage shock protein C
MIKSIMTKRLYRSRNNRVIAGVAAGIADYFDIDPIIVRLLFVVLAIGQGSGVLAYIIGWIIIPEESVSEGESKKSVSAAPTEEKTKTNLAPLSQSTEEEGEKPRYYLGVVFILIGAILVIQNVFGFNIWRLIVPLVLVCIGLSIIARNMRPNKS